MSENACGNASKFNFELKDNKQNKETLISRYPDWMEGKLEDDGDHSRNICMLTNSSDRIWSGSVFKHDPLKLLPQVKDTTLHPFLKRLHSGFSYSRE
jgi:hypothetical protein